MRPRRSSPLLRRALVGVTLAALLAVAGCSGEDDSPSGAADKTQGSEDPTTLAATSPLTGEHLSSIPDHPVVTVKIDNSSSSAPQLGLGKADLITEELVEGGITRLAVSFYSQIPAVVGPVRSMRATDIGIVQPLGATLVASGGAPVTVRRVKEAGIRMVTEGGPGFYRSSERSAPYNLFDRLPELVQKLPKAEPRPPYLPFGEGGLPRGKPATSLTAVFSGGSATSFAFRDGRYVNTNSRARSGDSFEPDTVLVLRVRVGDAGYLDPAGNKVPETKFTGKGAALVFHGGRVVKGSWAKPGLGATISLKAGGKQLTLPPGKVWIELVPASGGNVSFRR